MTDTTPAAPAQPETQPRPWYRRKRYIVWAIFIAFGIALAAEDEPATTAQTDAPPAIDQPAQPEPVEDSVPAYTATVVDISERSGTLLEEFSAVASTADGTPGNMASIHELAVTDRRETASYLTELEQTNPPAQYVTSHGLLVDALKLQRRSFGLAARATNDATFDSDDVAMIDEATGLMYESAETMTAARTALPQ